MFAKLPTTGDDRFVVLGSWSAGLALAWVICHRLMPWTGLLPVFVTWLVCGIPVLALATRLTDSVTEVRDQVAAAVVHAGALVLGIALLSAVLFMILEHPRTNAVGAYVLHADRDGEYPGGRAGRRSWERARDDSTERDLATGR